MTPLERIQDTAAAIVLLAVAITAYIGASGLDIGALP